VRRLHILKCVTSESSFLAKQKRRTLTYPLKANVNLIKNKFYQFRIPTKKEKPVSNSRIIRRLRDLRHLNIQRRLIDHHLRDSTDDREQQNEQERNPNRYHGDTQKHEPPLFVEGNWLLGGLRRLISELLFFGVGSWDHVDFVSWDELLL